MKTPLLVASFVLIAAVMPARSQDVLAQYKVKGLKGLKSVVVLVQPNTPKEVIDLKELGDFTDVTLHRSAPELKVENSAAKSSTWLVISIVTTEQGGYLELSVIRWVKVLDSGEEIPAKVWWDERAVFGTISMESAKGVLDTLLTSFAADYLRANR